MFSRQIDDRNSLEDENQRADDQMFYLKNLYMCREAEIMNIKFLILSFIEKKDTIFMEYSDVEDKLIHGFMDNFLVGIRSDMAKHTRLLNMEQNKNRISINKIDV